MPARQCIATPAPERRWVPVPLRGFEPLQRNLERLDPELGMRRTQCPDPYRDCSLRAVRAPSLLDLPEARRCARCRHRARQNITCQPIAGARARNYGEPEGLDVLESNRSQGSYPSGLGEQVSFGLYKRRLVHRNARPVGGLDNRQSHPAHRTTSSLSANTVRDRVVLSTIFRGLKVIDDPRVSLRFTDVIAAINSLHETYRNTARMPHVEPIFMGIPQSLAPLIFFNLAKLAL